MKVMELAHCPACGAGDFATFDVGAGNLLRKCQACGTVFAPEFADPSEIYVDGYMFGEVGSFGLDVRDPLFQHHLITVCAERRMGMIERASGLSAGSLLDVGSGTGEVLLTAQNHGWTVKGVEPERTAAEMAQGRGLDVVNSMLEESGIPEQSFDVVTAFHVLEHMPDSRAFLRTMARWARPGGLVVTEVPNFASAQRRRLRERWTGLRPLEHLVHFTPETLTCTFTAAGLEPLLVRSPTYIGSVQTLRQALADLARYGAFRRAVTALSNRGRGNGALDRPPGPGVWSLLHLMEKVQDRAGVGGVIVCAGRVS